MELITLFSFIILIFSVIIHEVSHGYMALYLGDPTAKYEGRLTLNPISHIDPIGSILVPIITSFGGVTFGWAKPVPFNPYNLRNKRWGEALVAIAGPLSNIVIAVVFGLLIRLSALSLSQSVLTILSLIVLINIGLAVFNLIPVPPLDGSKILFSLFPRGWGRVRKELERYQFILLIIYVFFVWQFLSPVIMILFKLLTGLSF